MNHNIFSDENKMNVILDLDSTIIHSLEPDEYVYLPSDFQNKFINKDMLGYVRIFARPNLEYFLDYLFKNYDVSVLTAADYGYGWFIIQNFILTNPDRKLKYFMHHYHTEIADEMYGKHKDLRMLFDIFQLQNMSKHNTVIIDDLDDVHKVNPNHAIAIASFDVTRDNKINYESVNDNDLQRVQTILETLRTKFEASPCVRQIYFGYTPTVESPFFL